MSVGRPGTSVVVDREDPAVRARPSDDDAVARSRSPGWHRTLISSTKPERSRRQAELQEVGAILDLLPFDAGTARS